MMIKETNTSEKLTTQPVFVINNQVFLKMSDEWLPIDFSWTS